VNLRYLHGSELSSFFKLWRDNYPDPYPRRYRKNIPFGYAKDNGKLLMTLRDGEVVFPVLADKESNQRCVKAVINADFLRE